MEDSPGNHEISEPALKRGFAEIALAHQEQSSDPLVSCLASHAREVMQHGDTRICFADTYSLARRIVADPALDSLKVHYWFLEQDSPRLTEEEERAAYEEDRELMEELAGELLSFEDYLALSESLPETTTTHFALLLRDDSRGFFIDTVGHMSGRVFPGLHELSLDEGSTAVSRAPEFRQMASRPISSNDIPDPITVTDRVLFTTIKDLPEV